MKITSVKKEKEFIVFDILLPEKKWKELLEKEILKAAKNLKIDGFRKGNVPLPVAKKYINEASCLTKTLTNAIYFVEEWVVDQDQFKEVCDEICSLEPVETKPGDISKGDITFTISFAKYLDFKVKNIKDFKIDKIDTKVTKEMIEKAIEKDLSKHEMMVPQERAAKLGDVVVIDFEGFIDGKPFDGGAAKNYELKLGSKSFIDNFENQLVGLKAGDTKDVNVTFPKNYHVDNLKNKKSKFVVKVNVVNEVEKPKLDDEFVKSLSIKDVNNVDQYKKKINQDLEKEVEKNIDDSIQKMLSKELSEMVPEKSNLSERLVISTAEIFISRLMMSLIGKVVSIDEFVKMLDGGRGYMTKETLIEEEKKQAREYLKVKFALYQYALQEKITVSDKEVKDEIANLAKSSNAKPEDYISDFTVYTSVKKELLDKKVFDFLKSEVLKIINK